MRTLAPEEFGAYVARSIVMRQERIIKKENKGVDILPLFAEKLAKSHLVSRKDIPALELSQEGKSPPRPQTTSQQTDAERGN